MPDGTFKTVLATVDEAIYSGMVRGVAGKGTGKAGSRLKRSMLGRLSSSTAMPLRRGGRILGFMLRSFRFAKDVVPLASTVTCHLIFLRDINRMGASLAFSLILLNVLTLYLIQLFGLLLGTMVVIRLLSTCCLSCTIIFHVAFGMHRLFLVCYKWSATR